MASLLSLSLLIIGMTGTLVSSYPLVASGGYPGFSPALLQTSSSLPAGTVILVPTTPTRQLPVDTSVILGVPVGASPTTGVLPTGTNINCCSSGLPLGLLGGLGGNISLLNIVLSLLLSGCSNPLGLLGSLPLQTLPAIEGGCIYNRPYTCNLPVISTISPQPITTVPTPDAASSVPAAVLPATSEPETPPNVTNPTPISATNLPVVVRTN